MSRPLSTMNIKNNEWRTRSISPNGDKMKRAVSPIPDALADNGSTRKYPRRPSSSTGAGQTVAALQQQHKWLMQQQENANMNKLRSASPGYRSVSPAPNFSRSKSIESIKQKQQQQQQQQQQVLPPHTNEDEVIFDDGAIEGEEEGDDIEEERMVIVQDTRSRSPSINRGSGGSIMSAQQAPSFYHIPQPSPQEFKVVKEGWLFRKNVMQQWKPVYAVAKHGNAVKPGGLYLYKDAKCTSHIHTYDMSEVLEISPRAKDFKQGIKWEILMRVKRENVILGTEDPQARKDWIESLTSIMGKVSIATQKELTSRIQVSEQMSRDLQEIAEELDTENAQLKEQIQTLKDTLVKKDRFYQQELQNKDTELKEAVVKKERTLQQAFQEREEALNTEMDRQRQAMEQKCEIFEREAMQWRSKYSESEKRSSSMLENYPDNEEKHLSKIESLELEVRKWRNRVDDLELQQKQMEYRTMSSSGYKTRHASSGAFESNDSVKELMTDVKFNLQLLKDHIKTPSEEPLSSIKTSIDTLYDTLESAKTGWTELQGDIIKFLEGEKEDADAKSAKEKTVVDTLRSEFSELREELFGVSTEGEDSAKEDKLPSLSEKFDILLQMVETIQISQSRLSTTVLENNAAHTDSSDDSMPTTPVLSAVDKDSDLYKAIMSQQQQLSEWIMESRENYSATLSTIESNLRGNRSLPSVPADKVTKVVENAMDEITQKQQQSQEEQAKHIKVIGNLLKLISDDIQASSIPDLAALSQQLEDVVERLNSTEERLSMLSSSSWSHENTMSLRNMPATAHLNDSDTSSQLFGFIHNTEKLMDRTLQVLSRHDGMEESIRRAVKGVSKDQLEEILNIQQQNKEERASIENKMQRYEENARIYFEKSIDKVHTDLHEFSGVMYEMLKELVLQALENSPVIDSDGQPRSKVPIEGMIELHAKLSGLNMALESEIAKLQEEKDTLESSVKKLQKTNKDLEREVDKRYEELRSVQGEYERVHKDVQRARQESTMNLARELEPLINQITRLKAFVSSTDDASENGYSDDYTDLDKGMKLKNSNQTRSKSPMSTRTRRYEEQESDMNQQDTMVNKLRFPNLLNNRNRRNSFNSQFSDSTEQSYENSDKQQSYQLDQQPLKSPLIGSRDRPRLKSPHSSFLGRK